MSLLNIQSNVTKTIPTRDEEWFAEAGRWIKARKRNALGHGECDIRSTREGAVCARSRGSKS